MAIRNGSPFNDNNTVNGDPAIFRPELVGTAEADNIFGFAGDDILKGLDGDDALFGGDNNDTLIGGKGNDILDGGSGDDRMEGGTGADTYFVDSVGDQVIEINLNPGGEPFNEAVDTVNAFISFSLDIDTVNPINNLLDNLNLLGSAVSGIGNGLSNVITGNELGNTLSGKAGNDTLRGNAGNDTLDGGTGLDELRGGTGDDTCIISDSSPRDLVIEITGQGIDTVRSLVSYTLEANVENLVLLNPRPGLFRDLNGTGNELANTISGNSGNNRLNGNGGSDILNGGAGADTLDGGLGRDVMSGGTGNDTYIVTLGDRITEVANGAGGGSDTVQVAEAIGFTLGNDLENLVFQNVGLPTSPTTLQGTGNALANQITGNFFRNRLVGLGGNDTLNGGGNTDTLEGGSGNDVLTGGTQADAFVFASGSAFNANTTGGAGLPVDSKLGLDTITDFVHGTDQIVISKATFTTLLTSNNALLSELEFLSVDNDDFAKAGAFNQQILYSRSTGNVFYNTNGSAAGLGTGGVFATLTGSPDTVTASDFRVVA